MTTACDIYSHHRYARMPALQPLRALAHALQVILLPLPEDDGRVTISPQLPANHLILSSPLLPTRLLAHSLYSGCL